MTGNEAAKIPPYTEYPLCWTHKGIKDTFDQVATEPANGAAAKYKEAGTKWSQGLEAFRQRMLSSIASAWEGNAAQASVNAIQRYTTDADQLTGTFTAVSAQVTAAAAAATDTKNAIPSMIGDPPWYDPDSWPWNKSVLTGHRSDAEDDARDKMTQRYVTPFAQTDSAIPVLPRPTNPTQPLDIAAPQPGDTGGDTGDTGSGGTSGTSSGSGGTDDPDKGKSDEPKVGESTTEQSVDSTNPSGTSGTPSSTNTTQAQSTGTSPTSTQTTPSSTNPGSPSGVPTGTGSPGTLYRSTGSPGRSLSGLPGASATGTSSVAAAAASAGRSSSSMPGMMGAGAGRGKQDENSQHETPDYLINQQNTEELLGETPKTIAGGVLGAKFRSAQVQIAEEPGDTGRTGAPQ